ncbi:UNVERIFIED_CONTAM: hypothetical protein GTU68_000456 [Idotea baltica]|nr:hypothetical protein [Idotea baltica]
MTHALILVDIQNDFLPGGALAVPEGDEVVSVANTMMDRFSIVVATQDWHPADHGSFASQHHGRSVGELIDLNGLDQVMWPDHCVQGTHGAEFADGLSPIDAGNVFVKGTDRKIDSYSGFFDNGHLKSTGLGDALKADGVTDVFILGLATDYCVKFTALDAVELGFKTTLIQDGCRGVNLQPDDVETSIEQMKAAGVRITVSERIAG